MTAIATGTNAGSRQSPAVEAESEALRSRIKALREEANHFREAMDDNRKVRSTLEDRLYRLERIAGEVP